MGERETRTTADAALEAALGRIQLSELQRDLLKVQWLDSLRLMDRRARRHWITYTGLRVVAILGGVFVPALVAVTPAAEWALAVRIATFTLSLCVAVATALESFFRSGEHWRHYRRNAELLRVEGLQFLMLAGPYADAGAHDRVVQEFAARVNGILSAEVGVYFTQVAVDTARSKQSGDAQTDTTIPMNPFRS